MRIALIGQAAFGKAVLEANLNLGQDDIVGVFPPSDGKDGQIDPLKEFAIQKGVPVFQPGRYRSQKAIDIYRSLSPELGVMAFVTDIVPDEIIEAPAKGTVQYHPSLLPMHRGPSSMNWPIIFGETHTGLTIFWPDKGLDTGPVLLQQEVSISPDDTLGSLYFDHLFPMGVDAMQEAINLVREDRAPRIKQDESRATYEGWCKATDAVIDWTKPYDQVYNLIRGCNPQPGAHSTYDGTRLSIFDSRLGSSDRNERPGTVIAISDAGVEVAAGVGSVVLKRVRPPGSSKLPARQYAADVGLSNGEILGT